MPDQTPNGMKDVGDGWFIGRWSSGEKLRDTMLQIDMTPNFVVFKTKTNFGCGDPFMTDHAQAIAITRALMAALGIEEAR